MQVFIFYKSKNVSYKFNGGFSSIYFKKKRNLSHLSCFAFTTFSSQIKEIHQKCICIGTSS